MESTSAPSQTRQRSFDARKFVLALLILLVSVGVLGWEVRDYRRSQALMNEEPNFPTLQVRLASAEESKAVIASIIAQLEAFKRDDYKTATKYQSARLRVNFDSVEKFRTMIQRGYPQFAHYKSARFSPVQTDEKGQLALVSINIIGRDGKPAAADYQMIFEDGLWRVAGVAGGNAIAPRRAPQGKGQTTA